MSVRFNFESDIRFLTGRGALRNAAIVMDNMGCRRVMIICDESSVRYRYLNKTLRCFKRNLNVVAQYRRVGNIAYAEDCDRALRAYKEKDCDSIIVVGQKSAINVAKAVKIMLKDDVSYMSNYIQLPVGDASTRFVPLTVIPTLMSSGEEASNSLRFVFESGEKIKIDTPFAQTNVIALDPSMCGIQSASEIVSAGLYALAMAITSLLSTKYIDSMTKVYALDSITTVTDNFKRCLLNRGSRRYRFNMAFATMLAGCAYWSNPNEKLSSICDAICDLSAADYREVFNILFLKVVEKTKVRSDFDVYSIINLIGKNQFVEIKEGSSGGQIIKDSVRNYYTELQKHVKCPMSFKDAGIVGDLLREVLKKLLEEKDGVDYDFALELLKEDM